MAVVVVDDESPDGTADKVREWMTGEEAVPVHLLEGQRRGLGSAYLRGMTYALDTLDAQVIVQMDADFSHDPASAERLLNGIAGGADVVLGSRYVSGGRLDEKWPLSRRLQSRFANLLARWIGDMREVLDCTSGFKAIRSDRLRAAQIDTIRAQGYLFQPALLHRLLRSGAKVVEEPIYFQDRRQGQTKFDTRRLMEVFRDLWMLRHGSTQWTIVKFGLTGLSGIFVNLGSFSLLIELGIHKFLASPLAIFFSILSNFLINNYWTFGDRPISASLSMKGAKYMLSSLAALSLSYAVFVVLSMLFPGASPLVLQSCGIPPGSVLNYLLNSRWIFPRRADEK